MAKEKSVDKEERRREKHARKEKRSEKDGVHKSKKDRKEKNKQGAIINSEANKIEVATELLNKLEEEKPGSIAVKEDEKIEIKIKAAPLLGALVPFANPLADEKVQKKVLKCVKKGQFLPTLSHPPFSSPNPIPLPILPLFNQQYRTNPNNPPWQPTNTKPSNAASKKSSKRFANPPQPVHPRMLPRLPAR